MKRKAVSKIEVKTLSIEGFRWLLSIDYFEKTQEERDILFEAAKIAYPDNIGK